MSVDIVGRQSTTTATAAAASPGQAPHLLHVFPSFGRGGVPIRIAGIVNELGRSYRHTIIALDQDFAASSRLDPSATNAQLMPFPVRKKTSLATIWAYRTAIAAMKPDLLLTYNWGAVEWALANRWLPLCPTIHFESGFGPEEADRQIARRVLLRRIALSSARMVIVPSRRLMSIASEIWRLDSKRLVHIPNGVDVARFRTAPDPAVVPGFSRTSDELIVGTLAPLRPEKNIARLIEAFAAIHRPGMRLLILGDGSERTRLVELAGALGIRDHVIFQGHVEEPEKALKLIDVFAISSDTEQMPNSLLQAMAAARPVVSVDVGDVREILPPEARRLVVPKEDRKALSSALREVAESAELRHSLGAANEAHVARHYAKERMVRRYAEAFAAALHGRRTPPQ